MAFAMKTVLNSFAVIAAVGLLLSIASHLAALRGTQGPLGNFTPMLHIGIFVVWIPTVLVANRFTKNVPRKDLWKVMLRGCPDWMKYMTYAFFGYAIVNFLFFITVAPKGGGSFSMSPQVVRGFSGHWMAFYCAALAVLYSAARLWDEEREHYCPNGHMVQTFAKFCDQCGLSVTEPGSKMHFNR
jgi:hypothetical protein